MWLFLRKLSAMRLSLRAVQHQRSRLTETTVFQHIHHKDRRQQQLSPVALHGCMASLATVTEQDTSSQSRIGRAMPFPPENSNTTSATALSASAAATLSLRVHVRFSSQSLSQDDSSPRASLVPSVKTVPVRTRLTKPPSPHRHGDRQE